jgi:CelD/BcsL family acetyltransferase involved in cellulose biosynthesis
VRHEKRLRRDGEVVVEHHTDPADIARLLPDLFDQHVERWADTPHPSLFLDGQQRDFYLRLASTVGPSGRLLLSQVLWNGTAVAMHFGSQYAGTFLWYKPTFSLLEAKRSPGEVLLLHLLRRAVETRATTFDFGVGDEPFKRRFATEVPHVRTWGYYPEHPGGSSP